MPNSDFPVVCINLIIRSIFTIDFLIQHECFFHFIFMYPMHTSTNRNNLTINNRGLGQHVSTFWKIANKQSA